MDSLNNRSSVQACESSPPNSSPSLSSLQLDLVTRDEVFRRREILQIEKEKILRKRERWLGMKERVKEKTLEEQLLKSGPVCLKGNSLGSERQIGLLLPGIPDEITLDLITTKLSWRECHLLQSVSAGWYGAIRDRVVYDTRVHFHLTQTFVLLKYRNGSLALRGLRDNSHVELPKILHDDGSRSPYPGSDSKLVALDGKVYVLGGVFGDRPCNKVYMLDVAAGQRSWNQVASMQMARSNFACSAMGGKIYVCGGTSSSDHRLCESEVYDPTENKWSFIKPMPNTYYCPKSEPVGEELFVFVEGPHYIVSGMVDAYHPIKDEWRKVELLGGHWSGNLFVLGGRLYTLHHLGLSIYSFEKNLWMQICSHSFTTISELSLTNPFTIFMPTLVLAVEDELIAFGHCAMDLMYRRTFAMYRCQGFDTGKKKLEWREEKGWFGDVLEISRLPIHL